jgi:nitric oxide reductase NorE protein
MIVFSMIFLVFLSEKVRLPDVFMAGSTHLDFRIGLVNTLILLTSSMYMALAVVSARAGQRDMVKRNLLFCLLAGAAFCLSKIIEYSTKIASGLTPAHDSFFSFYYFITGAHLLHVLAGMVFISHCWRTVNEATSLPQYTRKLEAIGLFWHFVDLVWLFIFPLLYLAGGAA